MTVASFFAVVEKLSFRRAAMRLRVTPAAISKAANANANAVVADLADLAAPLPCPIGKSVNSG